MIVLCVLNSPGKWLGESNSEKFLKCAHDMRSMDTSVEPQQLFHYTHKQQLTYFVDVALAEVKKEQTAGSDIIGKAIAAAHFEKKYVTCQACGEVVLRSRRNCKCPQATCGVDLAKSKEKASGRASQQENPRVKKTNDDEEEKWQERYAHIPSNQPPHPPAITVGDPIFANPKSFDSLHLIMRQIGRDAGISRYKGSGNVRSWTILCCDGLPYSLCLKLIDKTYACGTTDCSFSIMGEDNIKRHQAHCNPSAPYYREFDWVHLRIGDGHYFQFFSDWQ